MATKKLTTFSHLLEDRFDRITHHKVIVGQLQEHLAQPFLVVLERAWVVIQLRHDLTEIIQRNLLGFRLKREFQVPLGHEEEEEW